MKSRSLIVTLIKLKAYYGPQVSNIIDEINFGRILANISRHNLWSWWTVTL